MHESLLNEIDKIHFKDLNINFYLSSLNQFLIYDVAFIYFEDRQIIQTFHEKWHFCRI